MVSALLANPNLTTLDFGDSKPKTRSLSIHRVGLRSFPQCSAVDYSHGGNVPKFSRMRVWDPYKRLGISPYASEEEIWSSRNFLAEQYAGDESSVESIEAAFEKLLMRSFWERKKTKINLKTRLKKKVEESPPWVKNLLNFVELPTTVIILRRLFLFAFMASWSIMNSAEGGPAFQIWIPGCRLALWLDSGSYGTSSYFASNLDFRAPYFIVCVPLFVFRLHLPEVNTSYVLTMENFGRLVFNGSCCKFIFCSVSPAVCLKS